MNAPFIAPSAQSRERTAREQADALLFWHADLVATLGDDDLTAEDFERSARAALMSAERMADHAREEDDPDCRAMFLAVAGRYAMKARTCLARAKELRS